MGTIRNSILFCELHVLFLRASSRISKFDFPSNIRKYAFKITEDKVESIEVMDKSPEKGSRRQIVHELTARESQLLATDYPGLLGRKFIRKLHRDRPELLITLANKRSFRRDYPGDTLEKTVTKRHEDIFDVMQTHTAGLIDIDLFGGLCIRDWKKIETAQNWSKILLTFSKTWRHKNLPGLFKPGEDPVMFMTMWCLENKWAPPLMPTLPYRRPNKNAIMGIVDRRGPEYYTFLLQR